MSLKERSQPRRKVKLKEPLVQPKAAVQRRPNQRQPQVQSPPRPRPRLYLLQQRLSNHRRRRRHQPRPLMRARPSHRPLHHVALYEDLQTVVEAPTERMPKPVRVARVEVPGAGVRGGGEGV
jgi:hypothetical protein